MQMRVSRTKSSLAKLCCLFLLFVILVACKLTGGLGDNDNGSTSSVRDDRNAELCRKIDSCGCQSYDDCMTLFENDQNLEKPGVRECMLNSSCDSLCAGKPDGCGGGASKGNGSTVPERSNCAAIPCSNNSDCPSDCYGGCDGVRCYSF
jgi:hypothetical protein